ncbi:MAG: hypothetical protein LM590_03855 [Thermofilum sp.]|nr:hypothetical protein [Thermofilum sp.]
MRAGYKQLVGVVGLVYQNPEMQVITRSVIEELAMGPENLGLSREEIQKRIDWVTHVLNLYDLLDKDPQSLWRRETTSSHSECLNHKAKGFAPGRADINARSQRHPNRFGSHQPVKERGLDNSSCRSQSGMGS